MERAARRNRNLIGPILWIAMLCLAGRSGHGETLTVALEDADNRPLEYLDDAGRLTGFHVELVRQVASRLGWQVSFDRLPWQRALMGLEAGSVDAVTYVMRNPAREAYAVFLPGNRLSRNALGLWVLKSRLGEIRWEPPLSQMLERWHVGGVQGWFYSEEYRAAQARGVSLDLSAASNAGLVRMLLAGRIDAALADTSFLAQVGSDLPGIADRVAPVSGPSIPGSPVYIAFTRGGDGPAKAQDFAAGYAAWRETAEFRALVDRFGVAGRVKFDVPAD